MVPEIGKNHEGKKYGRLRAKTYSHPQHEVKSMAVQRQIHTCILNTKDIVEAKTAWLHVEHFGMEGGRHTCIALTLSNKIIIILSTKGFV